VHLRLWFMVPPLCRARNTSYFRLEAVRPAYMFDIHVSPRQIVPCDRGHQKRECDTNFLGCLLVMFATVRGVHENDSQKVA
jgi:hypothetical protein